MAHLKLAVFGKTPQSKAALKKEVTRFGFTYAEKHPDVVISYGGDGTFLWAERAYPQVPKALFRSSNICNKCHDLPIDHALELLKKGRYSVETFRKVVARANGKSLTCVNDIVIRNALPTHALRFRLAVNGKWLEQEFIGDGVVVSTVFGSTAYFHSITKKTFGSGIGLAFNNITTEHEPLILREKSKITVRILRGTATLSADNNPAMVLLKEGDVVQVSASKEVTKVVNFAVR